AGIYSDMTVDGPEIGTLVVIIDRAKNLPNRKSMGKQDPYCAARLGKEAKKTETDKRGGQTPKWDQELRFTVHDSPDYYSLKLSVFNDDKRTELIGEAWVSLDDVVVPGGGQSDMWQNLGCKGKYAGDVRLEITYYDTRPKPEKPKEPVHPEQQFDEQRDRVNSGVAGPRRDTPIKRRPLPSNPTSASQSPNVDVDHGRPLPNPSSGPRSYQTPPSTRNTDPTTTTPLPANPANPYPAPLPSTPNPLRFPSPTPPTTPTRPPNPSSTPTAAPSIPPTTSPSPP
ncbi:hypothetical protein P152DRAFT_364841, partial [Eremomyces bilateralis CBS 781.70]